MTSLLFLCVGASVLVLAAIKSNAKLHIALKKYSGPSHFLPRAITMLVITSQLAELVKVMEHVSVTKVVAALFLLAIVLATRSGTESELH
jgi:hypothetical protein